MYASYDKNVDYKQKLVDGEYEVQITKLEEKEINYERNGVPISQKILNIYTIIREDWNENPSALRGKTVVDTVFGDDMGKYDDSKLGPLVNAIPREDDNISFNTKEDLFDYIKGACVRIDLKIRATSTGKQRNVIHYMPTRAVLKKTEENLEEDLPFWLKQ